MEPVFENVLIMQSIEDRMVARLLETNSRGTISLHFPGSEMVAFMKDQYEPCQSLGQILLIVGTATEVLAAPCLQYMQEVSYFTTNVCANFIVQNTQHAVLKGSPEHIISIVQQFALLVACLRLSQPNMLSQSEVSISHRGGIFYLFHMESLQPVIEIDEFCWHSLFYGSVLAQGFPVPSRSGQRSIELPYHIMISLARVWYPVEYDGGVVLKGFSTILVPFSCTADSMQWHFISTEGRKRLPMLSIKNQIGRWYKTANPDSMLEKRAFLGYYPRVKIILGTQQGNYDFVRYSSRRTISKRKMEFSGATVQLSTSTNAFPGANIGTQLIFSKNQAMFRDRESQDYLDMLEDMKERPSILHDVDMKRLWLVSTISVVLHMIHVWAQRRPNLAKSEDNNNINLPFANPHWNGGEAALNAIKDNHHLELYARPDAGPYKMMDLVKKFWGNLESAIEALEAQVPNGIHLEHPRTIRAWELPDMVITNH